MWKQSDWGWGSRNHSCRIRCYTVGAFRAFTMENSLVKVCVLLDKGADIVEFLHKPSDTDFMWRSPCRPRGRVIPAAGSQGRDFLDYYYGGWQELFPNIGAPCEVDGVSYGMHGEVALLPWEMEVLQDQPDVIAVELSVRTLRTPYLLKRTMTLREGSLALELDEFAVNQGAQPMSLAWGHHPALGEPFLDDSCRILLEGSATVHSLDVDYGAVSPIGPGFTAPWPTVPGRNGTVDLSRVRASDSRAYTEFALTHLDQPTYCVFSQRRKVGFGMEWDAEMFPYLWVWQMFGGGYGYPFYGRAYTLALEPWSSLPGNLSDAVGNGTAKTLAPGESLRHRCTAFVRVE